jgi:hypothetical protein
MTDPQPSPVIFLHIPKTAGMSLRGLMVKNYRAGPHFNTGLNGFTSRDWQGCLDRLRAMPASKQCAFSAFKGHMPFGLHEAVLQPLRYITFLRKPVERAVSHYRHLSEMHFDIPSPNLIDPSQPAWNLDGCSILSQSFDNAQTRLLAAVDPALPLGECTGEHLRIAKANLDSHFAFVGLVEHFDLSLALLRRRCHWRWNFYVPDNVAPRTPFFLPTRLIEALRELNRFDLELYRHASARFEALLEAHGWSLKLEHRLFNLGNYCHQRLHSLRQWKKARLGQRLRPFRREPRGPSVACPSPQETALAAQAPGPTSTHEGSSLAS